MSIITDAITRLQAIAQEITSEKIRWAHAFPAESFGSAPMSIAYIANGTGQADDITTARLLLTVNVDFHVRRDSIKSAYTQLNNIIPEFLQRLAGDPTLDGNVDTIIFPVSFEVVPAEWDSVVTQMASFHIPLKFIKTPTT